MREPEHQKRRRARWQANINDWLCIVLVVALIAGIAWSMT